jgi:hypothetical protein
MIIGDEYFSIESRISSAYANKGILGIGYFVINIKGRAFGVKENDATCLACSFDAVNERIKNRGKHTGPNDFILQDALSIAKIVRYSLFSKETSDNHECNNFREKTAGEIYKNKLLWAPDGDAAFDDRSNILQFDIDGMVRLVGYKCMQANEIDVDSIRDLYLDADCYYTTLKDWSEKFFNEWNMMEKEKMQVCE